MATCFRAPAASLVVGSSGLATLAGVQATAGGVGSAAGRAIPGGGTQSARQAEFGAKTPWKRINGWRGGGMCAQSRTCAARCTVASARRRRFRSRGRRAALARRSGKAALVLVARNAQKLFEVFAHELVEIGSLWTPGSVTGRPFREGMAEHACASQRRSAWGGSLGHPARDCEGRARARCAPASAWCAVPAVAALAEPRLPHGRPRLCKTRVRRRACALPASPAPCRKASRSAAQPAYGS